MTERTGKNIAYFEDKHYMRIEMEGIVRRAFPNYKIIDAFEGTREEVERVIKSAGGIEEIILVMTDGNLMAGTKGWGAVEIFRDRGYKGPTIYVGGEYLPEDKKHLYTDDPGKPAIFHNFDKYLMEYLK